MWRAECFCIFVSVWQANKSVGKNVLIMEDMVVGMGEVLWDMLPEGRKMGGAPANFACHVSQFGWKGCVVSAVGDDALGREIRHLFRSRGIEACVDTVPYPTGTVQVELDAAGVPRYDIREEVAWDHIPFTPALEELAGHTRAVCFGSLAQRSPVSHRTVERFLDAMPDEEGRYKVFDINLRQPFYTPSVVQSSLRRCNVLKINDEELTVVSGMSGLPAVDMRVQCRELLARYDLQILILTCGVSGSYVFTPQAESFMPTPAVRVVDTVGAGDSFTAAFVSALLYGQPLREAHRLAVETSAYICTQEGATPQLPLPLLQQMRPV